MFDDVLVKPTRLTLARSVKKAHKAVEEVSGGKILEESRRLNLRHEVSHLIPVEGKLDGMLVSAKTSKGSNEFTVTLNHVGSKASWGDRIKSTLAPILFDKRFKQTLSDGDKKQLKNDLLGR